MKLVYICRALFKNGGLRSGPSMKMRGGGGLGVLSERPFKGKTGDLGYLGALKKKKKKKKKKKTCLDDTSLLLYIVFC